MVESQIRPSDIADRRILQAMGTVPREIFAPPERKAVAYADGPLMLSAAAPGESVRALLPPRTFARLLDAAEVQPDDVVLDIGCATGYSAAIIAQLASRVVALEIEASLSAAARDCLNSLGVQNVSVETGDLAAGQKDKGPYGVIILEGSVERVPAALFDQLAERGKLAAIVRKGGVERAVIMLKTNSAITQSVAFEAAAPPLPGFQTPPVFNL